MTTYSLILPITYPGYEYDSCLAKVKQEPGDRTTSDALTMLAYHFEAAALDLRALAKIAVKSDFTVSGDEANLIVSDPNDALADVKLENSSLIASRYNRQPTVIVKPINEHTNGPT